MKKRDIFAGAERMDSTSSSLIRVMLDKVRAMKDAGKTVIPLVAGEPDFNTPEPIKKATISALEANFTHYGSNRGMPELREKISKILERDMEVHYDPATEILVTCGGAEAINNALLSTISPGDEVIIFSPAFVSYENLVHLAGGTVVSLPLKEENGFQIDLSETEAHITNRTRMIILNNPCNPTGVAYHREILEGLAKLACKYDLLVFSDEIYDRLTYDEPFCSMASFPGMRERALIMCGFSKTYAMTGWRLGYLAVDKRHMDYILKFHQYSTTCCPTFLQIGLANSVDLPETETAVKEMQNKFKERRKLIMEQLDKIPQIHYVRPSGAFYVFIDVSDTGLSGQEFSERLLEEKLVGTVPGIGLGKECGDFVRLSYATSNENILEATNRMADFVKSLA
jgi:aspartate/methionine/tyrosine aminotransferase